MKRQPLFLSVPDTALWAPDAISGANCYKVNTFSVLDVNYRIAIFAYRTINSSQIPTILKSVKSSTTGLEMDFILGKTIIPGIEF